jgi:hypothetical protein
MSSPSHLTRKKNQPHEGRHQSVGQVQTVQLRVGKGGKEGGQEPAQYRTLGKPLQARIVTPSRQDGPARFQKLLQDFWRSRDDFGWKAEHSRL